MASLQSRKTQPPRAALYLAALVAALVGCRSKMDVHTIGGAPSGATAGFKVSSVSKLVTTPGEVLIISGAKFTSKLSLANQSDASKARGANLADSAGTALPSVSAPVKVLNDSTATVALPSDVPYGPYQLSFLQDGATQNLTLFSNGGKTDYPVATMKAEEVCAGSKFYDALGTLQTGTKNCSAATTLPDCNADGATGCVATASFAAALVAGLAPKIAAGNTVAGVLGTAALESHANCASDGGAGCVAASPYLAALTTGLAGKVLSGQTVAGIAGNVTLPAAGNVLSGVSYGVSGSGSTGSLTLPSAANVRVANGNYGVSGTGTTPTLGDCANDGSIGCVAVGPNYAVAFTSGIANSIVLGKTIAGVAGTVTLPAASNVINTASYGAGGTASTGTLTLPSAANVRVSNGAFGASGTSVTPTLNDCSTDGGTGCVATASFTAANMSIFGSGDVRSGVTIAGVAGALVGAPTACASDGAVSCIAASPYVAAFTTGLASKVLSGNTVAGVAGNVTLPAVGNVLTAVSYGASGTGSTGTLTLPSAGNVLAGSGIFGVDGTSVTPTLTLPTAANVRVGNGSYGVGGTGTSPTLADCSADGGTGCVSVGPNYAEAVTTGVASKVLSGNTVAGIAGNVTLPLTSNVLTPITYGAGGTALTGNATLPSVDNVLTAVSYGASGTGATGTLTLPSAGNVLSGSGPFGVGGTSVTPSLTLPTAANVRVSNGSYGVGGTGTSPTLADCSADGGTGCVSVGPNYAVAFTTGLASKVLSGNTVAGVAGNVTLPSASAVLTAATYGAGGTALSGNVTLPSVSNVLTAITYGAGGTASTGTLTLPSAGNVLSGSGLFGVGGTSVTPSLTLPTAANVRVDNGAFGVSGTSVTPTLADCSADGGTGCVATATYTAALTTSLAPKIVSGNTVAGVAGTTAAAPANCSTDGGTSCVAVASYPAAKLANFTAGNVQSGKTIAGVAGTLANCSADGGTGCVAVASYPAAGTTGLASEVLSGSTVAGIAGNVTLPSVGKVLSGITYGVSGTGLTGTLTLPTASNVVSGSATYGDPGSPVTPSYSISFPALLVRPNAPSITSTAFNFSPDRITLTWGAITGATGYIVLMNNSAAVSWTPTDGVTYSTGTYGSDTMIYSGSSTTVTYNTPVTAGTTYYFALYAYQTNQVYSYAPTTSNMLSCAGLAGGTWVPVPGDSNYGTNGFCVQKYIPSNVSGTPTSQTGTAPWVSISQTSAKTACSGLGTGYHLITNPEWMTLAANAANVASNWSGAAVGSGTLARGHSDNSPASACAADPNDANAWVQTNCTGTTQGALPFNIRRTKNLSNNYVVWDIGGNVWQWVDWYNAADGFSTNGWVEYSAFTPSAAAPRSMFVPINSSQSWWSDSWNSTQSIGEIYPGTAASGGALFRGASWGDAAGAGPFAANLNNAPSNTNTNIGFRCAWQT